MVIPPATQSMQGADGTFQPMPSLACLYPTYLPEVRVFACPSTTDTPQIAFQYYNLNSSSSVSVLHTCFGFASYVNGILVNTVDPAAYTGNEVATRNKCSYLYDELANPRELSADQAMAADADGQTWLLPGGQHPAYPPQYPPPPPAPPTVAQYPLPVSSWMRLPRQPNHDDGQNVMYLDGHVKWTDTVYSSHDPADNIFCPQAGWDPDTDAYLWDGLNSRTAQ